VSADDDVDHAALVPPVVGHAQVRVSDHSAKLDALLVAVGEVRTSVAVLRERQASDAETLDEVRSDVREIREAVHGSGSRLGLAAKVALLQRRAVGWSGWRRALVMPLVGLIGAATALLTAWASK